MRELEAAEQEKARLLAEKQDLEEEKRDLEERLAKATRKPTVVTSDPPPSMRNRAREYVAPASGLAASMAIVAALLKPVLDQRAELAQLSLRVDQQKAVAESQDRRATRWETYALELKAAHDCRWQQAASALAHLDYGLGDVDFSSVQWSPETRGVGWRKTGSPAFRTVVACKPFPVPPNKQDP